ncbi:MAG TPA: nucleotidyl transferase AbiEii/AbiGii toxin family protein, partial [Desulfatiglandales bacterium]|nr:nucleotidyl transferase AbiEii/AbiGii toxin family protein [Desulfatiglandales bacterium]
LAGGTGLALQLGHRKSEDLDFFSRDKFDVQEIIDYIKPEKISIIRRQTLHCVKDGVKLTFLLNEIDLVFQTTLWNGIDLASWEDIVSDKFMTISQRGAKKDFYDLYAAIIIKSTIHDICDYFLRRFGHTGINLYHILKSLVYFEDAEKEPEPVLMVKDDVWEWRNVKKYFEEHIKEFEGCLLK